MNRHREAHYLLEKFTRKQQFFFSSFLGIFFWAPIMFERYHFQSGCDPEWSQTKYPSETKIWCGGHGLQTLFETLEAIFLNTYTNSNHNFFLMKVLLHQTEKWFSWNARTMNSDSYWENHFSQHLSSLSREILFLEKKNIFKIVSFSTMNCGRF